MAERQPNHTPDPQRAPHEGGNGALGISPTLKERAKPPPVSLAHEGSQSPSGQPAVFGNCIVRDLMPSSERVDEMLAEGHMTEEQAAQQKKEALARERLPLIDARIRQIRGALIDRGLSTIGKRPLRAEYKRLRKEDRRLRKELWES